MLEQPLGDRSIALVRLNLSRLDGLPDANGVCRLLNKVRRVLRRPKAAEEGDKLLGSHFRAIRVSLFAD